MDTIHQNLESLNKKQLIRLIRDILVRIMNMDLKFTIKTQTVNHLRLKILKILNKNEELRRIM